MESVGALESDVFSLSTSNLDLPPVYSVISCPLKAIILMVRSIAQY